MSKPTSVAIKFTDENYATPTQLGKSLRLVTYDAFWREVLAYREDNKYSLPFGKIKGQTTFFITLTDATRTKISNFENKLRDFCKLARSSLLENGKEARAILLSPLLKEAAILEKSSITDLSIKMLLNSLYQENDSNHTAIVNYLSSLDYYLDQSPSYPDEDFLAGAYQKILGQEELMDFYREKDFDSRVSYLAYIANPDYPYAPCGMIEDLMGTFIEWLNNSEDEVPLFARAYIALFYLNYVKPFTQRNSLVASLLAKETIASKFGISEGFAIPIELLLKDSFVNSEACKEGKNRSDLTYGVFEAINTLTPYLENAIRQLNELRISTYKDEFSSLSEEEENIASKISEKESVKPTQLSFLNDDAEQNDERPFEKKDETRDSINELQGNDERKSSEPIRLEKNEDDKEKTIGKTEIKTISNLSIDQTNAKNKEVSLSKSEIKDYIRYLLETNPNLNKKQATFLANHNTQGRYYTIQQYKDFASCVYETARTSMDKLAQEGYYEKLQFKNKFVYSPTKKG